MKYSTFRQQMTNQPAFRSNTLNYLDKNPRLLKRQLSEWCQKKLVIALGRGWYTLNDADRKANISRYFLANILYQPSYISLESALSLYQLIPEAVTIMTSISTKKTKTIENDYGTFDYRHIATSYFRWFSPQKDEFNNQYFLASPEKALVDFLYFRTRNIKKADITLFQDDFRLQNLELIDRQQLLNIASAFRNKKLFSFVKLLCQYIEKNYD